MRLSGLFAVCFCALFIASGAARAAPAAQTEPPEIGEPLSSADTGPADLEDDVAPPAPPSASSRIDASAKSERVISEIRFENVQAPASVAKQAEAFIGKRITRENLTALAEALEAGYKSSDIAFFTIVVPAQTFVNGVVRVQIAEGYTGNIVVKGEIPDREKKLLSEMSQPLLEERPATRASLERLILLSNGLPTVSIDPKMKLGKAPGSVDLILIAEETKPKYTAGYSSRESELIDGGQFTARATLPGTLRAGDVTNIVGAAATDFEQSRYIGVSHSTPIAASGTRASLSTALQTTEPDGSTVSGEAVLFSLGLRHPVKRSRKTNVHVGVSLDGLNSDNAVLGSIVATERNRALRAKTDFARTMKTLALSSEIVLSQGIDGLGSRPSNSGADSDFKHLEAKANATRKFGAEFFVRARTNFQYADETLPSNERFSIGGARYGKGFKNGLLRADRSAAGYVETAYRPLQSAGFKKTEVYAFADYVTGEILSPSGTNNAGFNLGSAGAGFRLNYKTFLFLEAEAARPYNSPVSGFDDDWVYALRWRFSLRR